MANLSDVSTNLDYTRLIAYIQEMLSRSDAITVANIPTFISLAESRLAIDLKFLGGVQVAQFNISAENPQSLPYSVIIPKPQLWRQTKSMSILNNTGQGSNFVYARSYEYLQTYLADFSSIDLALMSNIKDLAFYADYDQYNWILGPYKRDVPYEMEVLYFSEIERLSTLTPVNYWTQYAPRALIYATLYEASYFLRSDERVTTSWKSNYDESIANLLRQDTDNFVHNSQQRKF